MEFRSVPRGFHTNDQCILRELLEEALLDCAVDEEVQRLGGDCQCSGEQYGGLPHGSRCAPQEIERARGWKAVLLNARESWSRGVARWSICVARALSLERVEMVVVLESLPLTNMHG